MNGGREPRISAEHRGRAPRSTAEGLHGTPWKGYVLACARSNPTLMWFSHDSPGER
jgi:hypothetical protein